jgi:dipeptidyl aminopeptidase/acylaminoacyl peptidase
MWRRMLRGRLGVAFAAAAVIAAAAPARIGPSSRELVEVADIEALAPSADGRKLAFRVQRASITDNSYSIDWYVADLATGAVLRVADGGKPIYNDGLIEAEAPIWSPDGRFFYHRAFVDDAIGIWRVAADGSGSKPVVVGDSDVESFELGTDGRTINYVTGPTRKQIERAERNEYDDGILVDATVDPTVNLYHGGYVHGRLSSQRLIGRWYEHGGLLWRVPRVRRRIDLHSSRELASEALPERTLEPLTASWKPPGLSLVGPEGVIAMASGSEDQPRLEIRRPRAAAIRCGVAPCQNNIVALAWRPGTSEVLFTTQDAHFQQALYLWNWSKIGVKLIARSDGQLSGGRSGAVPCAVTRSTAVCVAASSVSPPRLERLRLDSGKQDLLFDPNADLRGRVQPTVEELTFKLEDGRIATGTLLFRPGALPSRAPLFVNYYYCPGYLRGGIGDSYPFAPLVDAGIVVACLNTVPFRQWGDGADRERAALASVTSLVRLLDKRGWIDPRHVGMGGFSAGSEATMWVAMNSKLLSAAAVASPQYEPTDYWMSSVRGRDVPHILKEFEQVGTPDEDPERWKTISPALNVDRIVAPLLMQLPEQEMRAAIELYARLSNTTTPVEMYAYPDEAHIKLQPRHQLAVYRRNLEWFRYWLQDHVDPDPSLAAQYQRWDGLRRAQVPPSAE